MTTIIKPLEAKRVLRRKVPCPAIANKANAGGLQAKSDFLTPRQAGERHNVLTRLKNGIVSQYRVESKSNGGFIDDLAVILCHWGNGKEQGVGVKAWPCRYSCNETMRQGSLCRGSVQLRHVFV